MTTKSMPLGSELRVVRKASRTRRFMRLRATATPTLRDTINPRRVAASPCWCWSCCGAITKTKWAEVTRTPQFKTIRYSEAVRILCVFESRPRGRKDDTKLLLICRHSQTPAAAAAAVLEHLLAATGLEALAESVSSKAARVARLECALGHDLTPARGRGRAGSEPRRARSVKDTRILNKGSETAAHRWDPNSARIRPNRALWLHLFRP